MIAYEGRVVLIPLLFLFFVGIALQLWQPEIGFEWVNILVALLILFSCYFFREPQRLISNVQGFCSPADGKIIQIIDIDDIDLGNAKQISIFLSIFNVHSQWVPEDSNVIRKQYYSGKFLMAFNHKSSLNNERTEVLFETKNGRLFKIKQIAGLIARRILNYMNEGNKVSKGDRLGFIRFGSRVDILLPENFKLDVNVGDIVFAKKTILGHFV